MLVNGKIVFPWERKEELTPMMKEMIELVRRNHSSAEIAEMKGITIHAVTRMRSRILQRTGYSSVKAVRV
jgi:DNA-binding CsgD family transcriptional regulator